MPRSRLVSLRLESKFNWFLADLNTMFYAWSALLIAGLFISLLVLVVTGIDVSAFVRNDIRSGSALLFWSTLAVPMLPPFLLVFVFRRNFAVIGEQRQFRYICRWL